MFDHIQYAKTYPDLYEAFGYDAKKLWNHWVRYGKAEGRFYFETDKVPTFVCDYKFRGKHCIVHTFGPSDAVSGHILQNRVWEPRVAELIWSLCSKPRTMYIDAGCNIGTHLAIAKLAGAQEVHAFECNPTTIEKIEKTLHDNNWTDVKLWKHAVSNVEREFPFTLVKNNLGASYIPSERNEFSGPQVEQLGSLVAAKLIDSVEMPIDDVDNIVFKIDVEGHELQAFQGASKLFDSPKLQHLIVEINIGCVSIERIKELLEFIETHTFSRAKLLFAVPTDSWSGPELKGTPDYPSITQEEIVERCLKGQILEVWFQR